MKLVDFITLQSCRIKKINKKNSNNVQKNKKENNVENC